MIRFFTIVSLVINCGYTLDIRCEFQGKGGGCYLPKDDTSDDFGNVTTLTITQVSEDMKGDLIQSNFTQDSLEKELLKFPNVEHFWLSVGAHELTDALAHLALDKWFNLRSFSVSMNRIRSIPPHVLESNLRKILKLETIDFSFNLLEDIDDNAFTDLSTVRTLLLSVNRLASLKSGAFSGVSNVQTLKLNSNRIANIQETVFDLMALEHLELQNNNLAMLPPNLLENSPNLIYLDLSSNPLTNDFEKVITTAHRLQNLHLNNLLGDNAVDLSAFINLPELQTLSLVNTRYISASIANPSMSPLIELNLLSSTVVNSTVTKEILQNLSTMFPKLTDLLINGEVKDIEKDFIKTLFPNLNILNGADTALSFF